MKKLKTFKNFINENWHNVTEDTIVAGHPISYWLDYADNDEFESTRLESTADEDEIEIEIERVLRKYETMGGDLNDDEKYKTAYRSEIIETCKELCEAFFRYQGYIDMGVVSAYVMQYTTDKEAWEFSDTLVNTNDLTGLFDDI